MHQKTKCFNPSVPVSIKAPSVPLQTLSDLHLEFDQQYSAFEVPISSKYIVLAGDIGRLQDYSAYLAFLEKQATRFERVFLVLGNHEFHGTSFESGLKTARKLEQEPCLKGRLVLLDQRRFDIPDTHVTILGCTLWSEIPSEARDIVQTKIHDFEKIEGWGIDQHNAAHQSDLSWLRHQIKAIHDENQGGLKKANSRPIVVVTHYAPSLQGTSNPRHAKCPWSVAFGTDLISNTWEGVKFWIFGHTHYTTEFTEDDIRLVSNQRGYMRSRSEESKFDAKKVIWV